MTATEVLKRSQEKSMLLTPLVARQQNESLSPMIERELDILIRKGKLPPIPEEVGSVYDVVITYFSLDSSLKPRLPSYEVSQPLSRTRLTETHP
jgi:hypothetical protein